MAVSPRQIWYSAYIRPGIADLDLSWRELMMQPEKFYDVV